MKMNIRNGIAALLSGVAMPRPFDNPDDKQPGWKMDGDKIALKDGKPVYLDANGGENVFDLGSLARLNSEAAGHRRTAKEAADKLKLYDGIDPDAARAALQRVADLGDKELIDKGEVDKVRNAVSSEWEKKHSPVVEENKTLKGRIQSLVLDNAFANSAFIRDKIAVPLDMMKATFGAHFKYEDEKLVPYNAKGEKIYSVKNPGGDPDFEEAIEIMVSAYAHKDHILKGTDQNGNGDPGNSGNRGGKLVKRRSDFNKLSPQEKADFSKLCIEGKAQLIAD